MPLPGISRKESASNFPARAQVNRVIMEMMERHGTEVIYVRGNHDDFLDSLLPVDFFNLKIVKDFIHYSHGRKYYGRTGISSIA